MKYTPRLRQLKIAPHYCYDWDDLFVRPWDVEATVCTCEFSFKEWIRAWWRWWWKYEPIDGHGRCPVYLHRWQLTRETRWGKLYLHHIVGNDWSIHHHNHPKDFYIFGFWGKYLEATESMDGFEKYTWWVAPFFRHFPPEFTHRLYCENAWTLVWVSPKKQDWGFFPDGEYMEFNEYIKSPKADEGAIDCS